MLINKYKLHKSNYSPFYKQDGDMISDLKILFIDIIFLNVLRMNGTSIENGMNIKVAIQSI